MFNKESTLDSITFRVILGAFALLSFGLVQAVRVQRVRPEGGLRHPGHLDRCNVDGKDQLAARYGWTTFEFSLNFKRRTQISAWKFTLFLNKLIRNWVLKNPIFILFKKTLNIKIIKQFFSFFRKSSLDCHADAAVSVHLRRKSWQRVRPGFYFKTFYQRNYYFILI